MRTYSITSGGFGLSQSGVCTVLFLNPPSAGPAIEILRAWLSQAGSNTLDMARVQIYKQPTSFPSGLTSVTPRPLRAGDSTSAISGNTTGAAGTCGVNATAENAGSKTVLWEDNFNTLGGWLWVPTPAETIILPAGHSSGVGIYLPEAPADITKWSVGMVFRELG